MAMAMAMARSPVATQSLGKASNSGAHEHERLLGVRVEAKRPVESVGGSVLDARREHDFVTARLPAACDRGLHGELAEASSAVCGQLSAGIQIGA